jgi:hypothetical protein
VEADDGVDVCSGGQSEVDHPSRITR